MKKCVLLLSGGVDSVLSIKMLLDKGFNVYPLFIDYNHKAMKNEIASAKYYASYFNTNKLKIIKTSFFDSIINPLINSCDTILSDLKFNNFSSNYIPYRNLIFAVLGSLYCTDLGINNLSFGFIKKNNYEKFPDTSPKFVDAVNKLFEIIFVKKNMVEIINPAFMYTKSEIISYAFNNKIELFKTYSCYYDTKCGKCESCLEVIEAIKLLGLIDNEFINPYYGI
jgi:7-cyano-7-deazaguanine synthase